MMRIRSAAFVVASVAALALTGCSVGVPTGPATIAHRNVSDVTRVVLQTSGDLVVTLGATPSLTITAGSNVLGRLTSDSSGDTLTLGAKPGSILFGRIDYALTVTSLRAVSLEGSGAIVAEFGGSKKVELDSRGSGEITASGIDSDLVTVSLAGSGRISAAGTTGEQSVTLSGSGDYAGQNLESRSATVAIAGSGSIVVQASGTLDATITGSGSIHYSGGATVTSRVTGSGSITEG